MKTVSVAADRGASYIPERTFVYATNDRINISAGSWREARILPPQVLRKPGASSARIWSWTEKERTS
jgi:hypothetical protein